MPLHRPLALPDFEDLQPFLLLGFGIPEKSDGGLAHPRAFQLQGSVLSVRSQDPIDLSYQLSFLSFRLMVT